VAGVDGGGLARGRGLASMAVGRHSADGRVLRRRWAATSSQGRLAAHRRGALDEQRRAEAARVGVGGGGKKFQNQVLFYVRREKRDREINRRYDFF
jgi:hypothetical protein